MQSQTCNNRVSRYWQSSDGRQLHCFDWGTGSLNCCLVHGFGDGAHIWDGFAATLPEDIHALALDLPGHGRTPWFSRGDYDVAQFADLIARFIETELDGPTIVIGHSLGGDVALRLTRALPGCISALTLVDFGPELGLETLQLVRQSFRASWGEYRTPTQYYARLRSERPLADLALLQRFAEDSLIESGGTFVVRCDPRIADLAYAPDSPHLWRLLEQLDVPLLVVRGEGSSVLSAPVATQMVAVTRAARVVEIGGAGHGVMLDNPAAFAAAVREFIDERTTRDAMATRSCRRVFAAQSA